MAVKRLKGGYRLSTRTVVELMQKQNGKCFYCYKKFDVENNRLRPTIDHMHARSKGGSETDENNCCLSCHWCNMKKGNISIEKFLDGYICWSIHGRDIGMDCESITIEKKVRSPRRFWHKFIGYKL